MERARCFVRGELEDGAETVVVVWDWGEGVAFWDAGGWEGEGEVWGRWGLRGEGEVCGDFWGKREGEGGGGCGGEEGEEGEEEEAR